MTLRLASLLPLTLILSAAPVLGQNTPSAQVPDLITLYNQTLRISPAVVGADALIEAASQAERAAEGQRLPQIGAFGEAAYVDERIRGNFFGIPDVDRDDDYDRTLYGIGLEQAVLRPELWATLDQTRLSKVRAELVARQARSLLATQLMQRYLAVLEAVEVKAAAEARVDAVQQQRTQVGSRVEAGLLTRADASQAEASASLSAVQASVAESALSSAVAQLRATSQWSTRSLKGLTDDFTFILPQPLDEAYWAERAATQSHAVLVQQIEVAIARSKLEGTRRSRWPTVDIFGSATQLDRGGGIEGERDQRDLRIGARAQLPLFAGGSINAAISAQEARVIQAEAELERLVIDARLQAATLYRQVVVGRSQLIALEQAVEASRQAEREFRTGFDAGTRTNADLLSATERRFFAEVELQRRRYGQLVESLNLKQLAGVVGPQDIKQLNRLLVRPVAIPF